MTQHGLHSSYKSNLYSVGFNFWWLNWWLWFKKWDLRKLLYVEAWYRSLVPPLFRLKKYFFKGAELFQSIVGTKDSRKHGCGTKVVHCAPGEVRVWRYMYWMRQKAYTLISWPQYMWVWEMGWGKGQIWSFFDFRGCLQSPFISISRSPAAPFFFGCFVLSS